MNQQDLTEEEKTSLHNHIYETKMYRRKNDKYRRYSFALMFLLSIALVIVIYVFSTVVSSFLNSMEAIATNMKYMHVEMQSMSKTLISIEKSIESVSHDTGAMSKNLEKVSVGVDSMNMNMVKMQHEMHDVNKLNPARLFK